MVTVVTTVVIVVVVMPVTVVVTVFDADAAGAVGPFEKSSSSAEVEYPEARRVDR